MTRRTGATTINKSKKNYEEKIRVKYDKIKQTPLEIKSIQIKSFSKNKDLTVRNKKKYVLTVLTELFNVEKSIDFGFGFFLQVSEYQKMTSN